MDKNHCRSGIGNKYSKDISWLILDVLLPKFNKINLHEYSILCALLFDLHLSGSVTMMIRTFGLVYFSKTIGILNTLRLCLFLFNLFFQVHCIKAHFAL